MSMEIRTTPALIGIDRVPSRLEMQSQDAQMNLHHKEAKINLHIELPKIQIDQYDARASAGLKNTFDITKEAAQRGQQQALEAIGSIAEDGDRLQAIEAGGNAIAEIAKKNSHTEHEFGLDYIPKTGPQFALREGSVNIEAEPNGEGVHEGIEGDVIPNNLNMNYTPAQVNINLRQYGSIDIKYLGNSIDTSL